MAINDFEVAEMGMPCTRESNGTQILIVSAMFPLAKSKHSKEDYAIWLKNFLTPITTDIYMYTTPDLVETVKEFRGDLPITINSAYSSPFDIPPLQGRERVYARMNEIDQEKWHHSPELYAIWNAKPFLLNSAVQALKEKGKVYDYAFWNDGGSFRANHRYTHWPDPDRVQQVWEEGSKLTGTKKEDLLFFPIFETMSENVRDWQEGMGPIANPGGQVSEGSFFGGSPSTIAWFSKTFYAYHDYYISQWMFVGIDQDVFNSLFLLFPERIFTIWVKDQKAPKSPVHHGMAPSKVIPGLHLGYYSGECGDPWFYYQFWLSDRRTRDEMRMIWIEEAQWKRLRWWTERRLCQMTKPRSMMDILKSSFGADWNPPQRNVDIPRLFQ
ncbi:hypothetical protein JR316_0001845 [Psilocybe cubensis]|uniref:Uncharacterized protein n=2 Tax=Psilocybe cubensis TaxID=181762 RepID=A0A8H7Y724_PSICU|nr:hypothetical protein JR316_0001845 [Psilocybe cubensis]KAH9484941.1 hypothetical protein JR316_0001845 [Psilocybe cubensis]